MMHSSDKNHSIKVEGEASTKLHPDIGDLSLLLSGEASFDKKNSDNNDFLKLHVAECLQCQQLLTLLSSLHQSHHTIENTAVSEEQQMLVVDYVNRGFSIRQKKLLRQKIQDDASSLKAMLHYASHSEAMRLTIKEGMTEQESNHADDSKMDKVARKYNVLSFMYKLLMRFKKTFKCSFSFNFSTMYSILVSIVSVSLLFMLLSGKFKPVENNVINHSKTLENNSRVELEFISNEFNDSGFIYALEHDQYMRDKKEQNKEVKDKGKVSINLKEKETLHIAWRTSDKTNRYTLNFYRASNREKMPDLSLATTRGFVDLDVKNFEADEVYRWIFSYQTLDKKMFRAKGGFVIKPFSSKN